MQKRIKRFPDYEITDQGRVWCVSKEEYLEPFIGKSGYPGVWLRQKKKRPRYKLLHRIVAEAFLPPKPGDGYLIRHLDGNPLNNAVSNLKWGTAKENAADRLLHKASYATLDKKLEKEVRRRLKTKDRETVARELNLSFLTVNRLYYDAKVVRKKKRS